MCHSYQCAAGNTEVSLVAGEPVAGESLRGRATGERIPELPSGSGSDRKRASAENGQAKRVFPSISGSVAKDVIHCRAKGKVEGRSGESEERGEEGRRSLPKHHRVL